MGKKYIGAVNLFQDGKNYGATTRQVIAKDSAEAVRKLKKMFKFKNNKVDVYKLALAKDWV